MTPLLILHQRFMRKLRNNFQLKQICASIRSTMTTSTTIIMQMREVTGSLPVFSTTCILMVGKTMEGTIPGRHAYAGELTGTFSQPGLPS